MVDATNLASLLGAKANAKTRRELATILGTTPLVESIDDVAYWGFDRQGALFLINIEDTVFGMQLMSEGVDGFSEFVGHLPFGLRFGMTPDATKRILGTPIGSGEYECGDAFIIWTRFICDGKAVHCEHSGTGESLTRLTVTLPK